jgi:TRAP-type C4-dicarboxylate transport system permease small subunit
MLKKLDKVISSIEKYLLVILGIVMTIVGASQVISRYIFKSPITWTESLLTYMFVWGSFIGASVALSEKSHFSMEVIVERFPQFIQQKLKILINILMLGFIGIIIWKGSYLVIENQSQIMSSMPFAMSWPYLQCHLALLVCLFIY